MKKFTLEIITPERIAFSEEVEMVTAPSVLGTIGILPRHIPLFAQLTEGELKIKTDNHEYFLAIGGGFIEVSKTKVIVLVTRAVDAKDLNEQEIKRARESALEALKQKPSGLDLVHAQALLRQSLTDMRILRKRHRVH